MMIWMCGFEVKVMKRRRAAALEYNRESSESAPRIIAVGEGHIAERIITLAREEGIPVYEDVEIVAKLVRMPLGSEIPSELYQAVAKVLALIYRLEEEQKTKKEG